MARHRPHTVDPALATEVLAGPRIAVVGASEASGNFGRTIASELRARGREVVVVHPSAAFVDGFPAFASLAHVPDPVDAVVVMVPAEAALDVVRDCATLGISKVWLFRGIGSVGAARDDVVELARDLGLEVVPGACPLMFLEPVSWFHRIHRSARRARGAFAAA